MFHANGLLRSLFLLVSSNTTKPTVTVTNFGGTGGNSSRNGGNKPMWKKVLPIAAVLILGWIGLNLFSDKAVSYTHLTLPTKA